MSCDPIEITYLDDLVEYPADLPLTLNFSSRQLTLDNVHRIAGYLRGRKFIWRIDLNDTNLTDEGVQILADAIRESTTLRIVAVRNNQIGDQGAKIIAQCLDASKCDIDWCVSGNRIGPEGGEALTRAYVRNLYSVINLSGNQLGDEGAKRIAVALGHSCGQIGELKLNLKDNNITIEGDRALAKHLPRHIDVCYRREKVTRFEYFSRRSCPPLRILFTRGLPIFSCFSCRKVEDDIWKLSTPRTGPRIGAGGQLIAPPLHVLLNHVFRRMKNNIKSNDR